MDNGKTSPKERIEHLIDETDASIESVRKEREREVSRSEMALAGIDEKLNRLLGERKGIELALQQYQR